MTTTPSPRGQQLQRALALNLQLLSAHDKIAPREVEAIIALLVAHVRSWRPLALSGGLL